MWFKCIGNSESPTPPITTNMKVRVVTHTTGGFDASVYLKLYENNVLIKTIDVLYTDVPNENDGVSLGCVRIWYSRGWYLRAIDTCEYDNTEYVYGEIIDTWSYNTSVDMNITFTVEQILTYKTYAKFDGYGIKLPFSINSDYKVTVEFNQQTYVSAENIIGQTGSNINYSHLTVYDNEYYTARGSDNVEGHFGTWSAGDHTFTTNNGNSHNEFDGTEVTAYSPSTSNSIYYTIGIRDNATEISSYIKHYQIESISTGDIICDLRPCLFDNTTACLYDTINKKFYYAEGLTVTDTPSSN